MASVVIDGLVVPLPVADQPTLNFCNTRAGWGTPHPKEYLHSHTHLVVWARENGVLPADAVPRLRDLATRDLDGAAEITRRAIALRSALYGMLVGGDDPADWAVVNAEVHRAAAVARLAPVTSATPVSGHDGVTWDIINAAAASTAEPSLELPLLVVAWSAAFFLISAAATQVAACPGQGCGWLFADPRRRRRWCSMAWCGNRNKARRHAQRARSR